MSHLQTFKRCILAMLLLALMQLGPESQSYGVGCLPPTPGPCAADGKCRPKRETWGHYNTRWRPWPGEPMGQQPTVADQAPEETVEEGLKPFDLPKPEDEDLRGPAKDKKESDEENADTEGDAAMPLPGPDALDPFDPQGNQLQMPSLEDAPPALPESLRQSALLMKSSPQITMLPATTSSSLREDQPPVRPVSWQQPAIGLVNPASATLVEPATDALQQAIYYEASDYAPSDQGEPRVE